MPQISEKTIEESLRALKAMELIEVQMITVPEWDNAYVRGISVLPKGLEYNASFYHADEQVIIDNLKEQMRTRDQELVQLREQLKNIKAIEVPKEFQDEKEAKIIEEAIEKDEGINYDNLGFKELIKTVSKEFGATSEPICNAVNGWQKETKFYINSYNKLTVLSPLGEVAQLKNPIEINNFWKYISDNRHKIGKVIDFTKELDVGELNKRYGDMDYNVPHQ